MVASYPFISKTLRDAGRTSIPNTSHCCTAQLQKNGTGYNELNDLLAEPMDLEFTIGLITNVTSYISLKFTFYFLSFIKNC